MLSLHLEYAGYIISYRNVSKFLNWLTLCTFFYFKYCYSWNRLDPPDSPAAGFWLVFFYCWTPWPYYRELHIPQSRWCDSMLIKKQEIQRVNNPVSFKGLMWCMISVWRCISKAQTQIFSNTPDLKLVHKEWPWRGFTGV